MSAAPETSPELPAYRALILRPDGSVAEIQKLLAADDDEAIALAQAMVDGQAVELWDSLRFIEHFGVAEKQSDNGSWLRETVCRFMY